MRRERERAAQQAAGSSGDLPFGVYLLFSSFTAIAAVSAGLALLDPAALAAGQDVGWPFHGAAGMPLRLPPPLLLLLHDA